jgi:hypothetical protein
MTQLYGYVHYDLVGRMVRYDDVWCLYICIMIGRMVSILMIYGDVWWYMVMHLRMHWCCDVLQSIVVIVAKSGGHLSGDSGPSIQNISGDSFCC